MRRAVLILAVLAAACAHVRPVPPDALWGERWSRDTAAQVQEDGYWFIRTNPMAPPVWYRDAYDAAYACAAERGLVRPGADYNRLRWYTAQSIVRTPAGQLNRGVWSLDGIIWLDEAEVGVWDTVYHELLHEVMGTAYGHAPDGSTHPEFARCLVLGRRAVRLR